MKPVLVGFGTVKGGASKSTLTVTMANFIHHLGGKYRVCVIDADDKQQTVQQLRSRDKAQNQDPDFDWYNIESISSADFPEKWLRLDTDYFENFDFVFIDLPGSIKQKGVIQSFALLDLLFVPFNLNQTEIDATVKFLIEFKEVETARKNAGYPAIEKLMLLSRIDKRSVEAKKLEEIKGQLQLKFLSNFFPLKPALYGRDLKTFLVNGDEIDKLTQELCNEIFQLMVAKHKERNA